MLTLRLLAILLLSTQVVLAQTTFTLEGRVTDHKTNAPLAYVNIYVTGTDYGTVTNQSGEFTLKYRVELDSGTVTFSHIGYRIQKISLTAMKDKFITISMENQSVELHEIVITPPDPLELVYNSVAKISENYPQSRHAVSGFQREYVSHSGNIIQVLEATFNTTTPGIQQGELSTIIDARYIEDKQSKAPLWSPSRGGFYTFGWTTISGIVQPDRHNFLGIAVDKKGDLSKHYEFTLLESVISGQEELYVIAFDQKKEARQALLKGTIYIDVTSGAIVKIIHELSPRGLKYLKPHETYGGQVISKPPKKLEIKSERCETTYRKYGSKWYLHTQIIDAEFDASLVFFRVVNSEKLSLKHHSERLVMSIDSTGNTIANTGSEIAEIGKIPTLQNFIKKNFENYDEREMKIWSDQNIIRSDTSFTEIAHQLHAKNQAWESGTSLAAAENAMKVRFKSSQLIEDLDFLKASLEGIHPGLYWYTDKETLDRKFNSIKQELKGGGTESELFVHLGPLIEMIHCGHTNLLPSANKKRLLDGGASFPLKLIFNGDTAVVSNSGFDVSAGSQLISINAHQMTEIIQRIKANISADGYNTTYKDYRLEKEFDRLLRTHYAGNDSFNITLNQPDGRVTKLLLPGTLSMASTLNESQPNITIIDSLNTALLTIPSFANEGFPEFLESVFAKINNKGTANLIIDLRNNEGGRDETGLLLFSYLAREPFEYYKKITVKTGDTTLLSRLSFNGVPFNTALPDYSAHIEGKNFRSHTNLGRHQPRADAFKGHVYVLINGGTFSTAAEFASITRSSERALFVGSETGGGYYGNCSLGTPTLTLPNSKLRVSIPLAQYQLAVRNIAQPGRGVIPDYDVAESIDDSLRKKDKVLEYCLELIVKSEQK